MVHFQRRDLVASFSFGSTIQERMMVMVMAAARPAPSLDEIRTLSF